MTIKELRKILSTLPTSATVVAYKAEIEVFDKKGKSLCLIPADFVER
jgi:hypothetical protein